MNIPSYILAAENCRMSGDNKIGKTTTQNQLPSMFALVCIGG